MEAPLGGDNGWLDTATVTVQGTHSGSTRRAKGGDFYLANSEDSLLATSEDFLMATDKRTTRRSHRRPHATIRSLLSTSHRTPPTSRGVATTD